MLNEEFYSMPGLGALYSRASTYVFGDWNKCGELMGLAPYGRRDQVKSLLDFLQVALDARLIGPMLDVRRPDIRSAFELHILRDVDQHRPRPACCCDVKCLMQDTRQITHIAHQPIVLGARTRDPNRICFLECIGPDQVRRHLARNADQRNRIHQRIGKSCHGVRGTGP